MTNDANHVSGTSDAGGNECSAEDLALLSRFEQVRDEALASVAFPRFHVHPPFGNLDRHYRNVLRDDPDWFKEDSATYRKWRKDQAAAMDAALLGAFSLAELEDLLEGPKGLPASSHRWIAARSAVSG